MFHTNPAKKVAHVMPRLTCYMHACVHAVLIILKQPPVFFLPHQNLAKSHHLSSGAKDSKPLKYINTDIREQNIYDYD